MSKLDEVYDALNSFAAEGELERIALTESNADLLEALELCRPTMARVAESDVDAAIELAGIDAAIAKARGQ